MSNLNLCVLEGHVNTGIEYIADTQKVTFTVVVNRKYGVRKKLKIDKFNVEVDSAILADNCRKYLGLGSHVLITGWMKEGGIINAREIKFLPKTSKKEVADG